MSQIPLLTQEFSERVNAFKGLNKFGFTEKIISNDDKIKEIHFESSLFVCIIALDFLRGEIHSFWRLTGSKKIIPDPMLALCYFSLSLDDIINQYNRVGAEKDRFSITLELYSKNSWIFSSVAWVHNEEFIEAIRKTDEWAWSEFRPLNKWEYEKVLCGLKIENNNE